MARTPNIDLREDYQRNYIINGNFDFWQRGTSGTNGFVADRFSITNTTPATSNITRSTDVPTVSQSGHTSVYSMNVEMASTFTPSGVCLIRYFMEGNDSVGLYGKIITLSFWVKCSKAGTYSVSFHNNTSDRVYVTDYTVDQANTWERKSITIKHDSSGTWFTGVGIGLEINWAMSAAAGSEAATTDEWITTNSFISSNHTQLSTSGDYLRIGQVQITEGAEALSFRRAGRTVAEELAMCQRYYEKSYNVNGQYPGNSVTPMTVARYYSSTRAFANTTFVAAKRTVPTISVYSAQGTLNKFTQLNGANDASGTINIVDTVSEIGFSRFSATGLIDEDYWFNWVADAEF